MISLNVGAIFDGDDTLWETQSLYVRAKNRFFAQMEQLGFFRLEAEVELERIDLKNAKDMRFSRKRFPKSMSDTYQELCLRHNKKVDESVKKRVESIGYSALEGKAKVFDGVLEVLEALRSEHLTLILATKGDQKIQKKKIDHSGLSTYFCRIYIFPEKGQTQLKKIVKDCGLDPKDSWSIGNSIKSDINPALRIGLNAIWIPINTWDFEEETPVDDQRLFKASSIKEVPRILTGKILSRFA